MKEKIKAKLTEWYNKAKENPKTVFAFVLGFICGAIIC